MALTDGRVPTYLDGHVVLEEVDLGHVVEGHNGTVAQQAHRRQEPELRLLRLLKRAKSANQNQSPPIAIHNKTTYVKP